MFDKFTPEDAADFAAFIETASAAFHLRLLSPVCDTCEATTTGTAMQLERWGWRLIGGTLCPEHEPLGIGCYHGCADYDTHQTIFGGGHSEFPE
jgi:hypothetical protein